MNEELEQLKKEVAELREILTYITLNYIIKAL